MSGFSKLFRSIVTSSIWIESDAVLRVWTAMLATCDAKGFVEGSIPGFAHLCRKEISEMEEILKVLSSPDKYSRSREYDGRRIATVDGGWQILNYEKYRNTGQSKEGSRAKYMRGYRKKKKDDDE